MPDDPQSILIWVAIGCLVPPLLGRLLHRRLSRGAAALAVGLLIGIPVAFVAGPKIGLLAGTWSLLLGFLGTSHQFFPSTLDDLAQRAKGNRRWWDHFGG